MREEYTGQKLCIFISKNDTYEGIILYELLLEFAFNSRLSGGMVTIGDQGFISAQDESAKHKLLRSAKNPPVLLEFQGTEDRIDRYVERIQPFIKRGLLTRTDVQITKIISPDDDPADVEEELNEDQEQIFDIPESDDKSREFHEPEVETEDLHKDPEDNLDELIVEDTPRDFQEPEPEIETGDLHDDSGERLDEPITEDTPGDFQEPEPEPEVEVESVVEETEATEPLEQEFIEPDTPDLEVNADDQSEASQPVEEEEEEPLILLSEQSETQPEEAIEDDFELDDPLDILEDLTNEPKSTDLSDDEVDKLFDEDIKEFESSFESMLNKTKKARKSEQQSEGEEGEGVDKKDIDPSEKKEGEDVSEDSDTDDKNHTDDELKKYFSSMFIK